MKKLMFLTASLLCGVAGAFAQNATAERNAVCIDLKSGQAKYVAFVDEPEMYVSPTDAATFIVASKTGEISLELTQVDKITAVYHDFNATGVDQISKEVNREVESVYDLSGRKVSTIIPGQVYILKYTDGSAEKTIKNN